MEHTSNVSGVISFMFFNCSIAAFLFCGLTHDERQEGASISLLGVGMLLLVASVILFRMAQS